MNEHLDISRIVGQTVTALELVEDRELTQNVNDADEMRIRFGNGSVLHVHGGGNDIHGFYDIELRQAGDDAAALMTKSNSYLWDRIKAEATLSAAPNFGGLFARIVWHGKPWTGVGATSNAALTDLYKRIEEHTPEETF